MSLKEIKVKNDKFNYSILIGNDILNNLSKKIKILCPNAKKICLVLDKKIPIYFKKKIKKNLKNYQIFVFEYISSEKLKSFKNAGELSDKLLKNHFNRSDIVIAAGGGVIGDFSAFVASITKRGINFINIPSTLLAQVDSSIGGKTGVNSKYGKNLIGSFYQPKLVIADVELIKSLPRREIICGYAEILKHSIIRDKFFFNWLKLNSKELIEKKSLNLLKISIYRSCKIKLYFVNQDVNENDMRMTLNFGHTFAHAIEAKNNFAKKINHGEAVLIGMMLATKLSFKKKLISRKTLLEITDIYERNNINLKISDFFKNNEFKQIIKFMINDKKNNDKKINLILLKKIGKTTRPGNFKMKLDDMNKIFPKII